MTRFILNVDDYAPGRYSRTKILTQAGFEVKEAASGREALQIAKEKPQLILLDVNLPDIDGFEVCRRIKQNPDTAGTIVLHLSASSVAPEHWVEGLDGGADSYLTEPIPGAVLVATVRALLRAHSAEEALRYSNTELQHFAGMVSHELREPLRHMLTFTQLLNEKLTGKLGAQEQEYIERTLASARRMNERIDSILEYSRAEHGHADIVDVSAEDALTEALDELQLLLAESGAKVHRQPLPRVRANRTGLTRVFANLIMNAIKYKSAADPVVKISVELRGDAFLFAVQDNGIGIDSRYHRQIFEAFKRLHNAELAGSGLGLALCRRVVRSSGGEIWVDSVPGQGSTFYFTLPVASVSSHAMA